MTEMNSCVVKGLKTSTLLSGPAGFRMGFSFFFFFSGRGGGMLTYCAMVKCSGVRLLKCLWQF